VTVFSTDVSWTYDVNQSHSRSRNSPFHGKTFRGGPMAHGSERRDGVAQGVGLQSAETFRSPPGTSLSEKRRGIGVTIFQP
jgi:hypothetical protein